MPNTIKTDDDDDSGQPDNRTNASGQPNEAHHHHHHGGNVVMVPSQHIKAEPHLGVINYHVKTAPMQPHHHQPQQHHLHHQYWQHLPQNYHQTPAHQLLPPPPPPPHSHPLQLHHSSELRHFSPSNFVDSVAGPSSSSASATYQSISSNYVSTVRPTCDDFPLPLLKPKLEPPASPEATPAAAVMLRPSDESPRRGDDTSSSIRVVSALVGCVDGSIQSTSMVAGPSYRRPSTVVGIPMATQTETEPDTEEDEDATFDEDAVGENSSGSASHPHRPLEMPSSFDRSLLPENVREHVDTITAQHEKLHSDVVKQKLMIKKLRVENANKCKEIDQIKDLNIILQLELEKYRSSDAHSSADRETKVNFPDGITLTAYNIKDLECCEVGEKGDSAFILKMLLALYTREELRMKSITGKPSRNKKYVQDTAEKFSPKKLQFIKDKFRERVSLENTMPTEREKRCRDERVHKIINTKIQNLKRKKATF